LKNLNILVMIGFSYFNCNF